MEYRVLVSPEEHFLCKDPDKFYKQLEKIADKNEKDVKLILKYYLHKHFFVYLYHSYMQATSVLEFTGPDNLLESAKAMTDIFKDWLPEDFELITKDSANMFHEWLTSKNEEE